MVTRIHFTQAAAAALTPTEKRVRYYDEKVPNLALSVSPKGRKSWHLVAYRDARTHDPKLGTFPAMSVDEARKAAVAGLARLDQGLPVGEPSNTPKGRGETFGDLWSWWLDSYGKRRRDAGAEANRQYKKHLAQRLGNTPAQLVTKERCRRLHAELSVEVGKVTANVILELVRTVYLRADANDVFKGGDPTATVEPFVIAPREDYIPIDRAGAFFAALMTLEADDPVRDLAPLLLFTGTRVGEAVAMRWDEIDLKERTWRIPMAKDGAAHIVPLDAAELAIIEARRRTAAGHTEWVFPAGRSDSASGHMIAPRSFRAFADRSGFEGLTYHGLRRTHARWLLKSGVRMEVVSKMLNHSTTAVTQRVYGIHDLDTMRSAKAGMIDIATKRTWVSERKVPRRHVRGRQGDRQPDLRRPL